MSETSLICMHILFIAPIKFGKYFAMRSLWPHNLPFLLGQPAQISTFWIIMPFLLQKKIHNFTSIDVLFVKTFHEYSDQFTLQPSFVLNLKQVRSKQINQPHMNSFLEFWMNNKENAFTCIWHKRIEVCVCPYISTPLI